MFCASAQAAGQDLRITQFQQLAPAGNRPSWNANNVIAYDAPSPSGHFDVYTMNPDGSNVQCLTCNAAALPPYNKGLPAWHPGGAYLVIEVQTVAFDPNSVGAAAATPGGGFGNDLFVTDAGGKNYWRLTSASPGAIGGVLHPRFSHDGTKLLWTQAVPGTSGRFWNLLLADFAVSNGVPGISNVQSLPPCASGTVFCESGDFSHDDTTVFFTGALDGQPFEGMDIYSYGLSTQKLTNLTNSPSLWDELPTVLPNQDKIAWIHGVGNADSRALRTDYWMMDYDGSNKLQLTYYNYSNAPVMGWNRVFGAGAGVATAQMAWSPDGTQAVGQLTADGVPSRTGGQLYLQKLEVAAPSLSGASYARPPLGQDSIISTFYNNLASTTANATGASLPTDLGSTTATLTDSQGTVRPVPLFFVSPGQVNWLVPPGTAPGPAILAITNPQGQTVRSTIDIENVGPGLFSINGTGQGPAIGALLTFPPNSTQYTQQNLFTSSLNLNPVALVTRGGANYLELFGTGLRHFGKLVTAQIGSQTFPVSFAGAQGAFSAWIRSTSRSIHR